MHDLDRIEAALEANRLDAGDFERFAQDSLSEIIPGLTPIPGGTDWGRDADVARTGVAEVPPRIAITTSRTLDGVRKNMLRGLRSMKTHGVEVDRLILANPARLTLVHRNRLARSAAKEGAKLDASDIFEQGYFASRLRRDGYWRKCLLGLSSEPITLSRVPSDLAESPWARVPLIGRSEELSDIEALLKSDVILAGPPGSGKSRLLAELLDVVFVDADAGFDAIANDLRWSQPKIVCVDDAARHLNLVGRLRSFRRAEPDIAQYAVIAVCWPHEVDDLQTALPGATIYEIDLLERLAVDELVQAMGITAELARAEILDQAEGRPGWAVALGDVLLRSDGASLLQGKELLGQVSKFYRRAGLGTDGLDLLTIIAALGGAADTDVKALASELNLPQGRIRTELRSAARAGLVDVTTSYSHRHQRELRHYAIRPPMLARVLVVERGFTSEVAHIDLASLGETWPDHEVDIARSVCEAAALGASGARSLAASLFRRTVESDAEYRIKVSLADSYARIDRAAAEEVLTLLRSVLDESTEADVDPWLREPVVGLASRIGRWYFLADSIVLLLDAAVRDLRPPHSHPYGAPRQLDDLIHRFHPELPWPSKLRDLVAATIDEWLGADPSLAKWMVYGDQVENVLSLHLSSSHTSPVSPATIQMIETIVSESEIERVYKEVWPQVRTRLSSSPSQVIRSAATAAEDWLRIGGGYDRPFGNTHSASAISAARRFGVQLLGDIAKLVSGHPGLAVYVRDIADRFDVDIDVLVDETLSPFFADIDRRDDWRAAIADVQASITATVEAWADEEPMTVTKRLLGIRDELALAGINWPDRVEIACTAIAERVSDPHRWLDSARETGLFPEGASFVRRAQQRGELGEARLERLLTYSPSRWVVIDAVFREGAGSDLRAVLAALRPDDYQLLRTMFLRGELGSGITRSLLTEVDGPTRGAVAAAIFAERRQEDTEEGIDWRPEHASEWEAAVDTLEMAAVPGLGDHEAAELTAYLARVFPQSLARIVNAALDGGATSKRYYEGLPHGAWDALHLLPSDIKDELWTKACQGPVAARRLLRQHLVGTDVKWLEHCLDAGTMEPEEALSVHTGMGPEPTVEQMARLLVPRGVDPREIASLAQNGGWTGEESARYARLAKDFAELATSEDQSVAEVGVAGAQMFLAAQQRATGDEKQRRIKGLL